MTQHTYGDDVVRIWWLLTTIWRCDDRVQFDEEKVAVYDTLTEQQYTDLVNTRRKAGNFVVQDGEDTGYEDDGEEHLGDEDEFAGEDDDGDDDDDADDGVDGDGAGDGAEDGDAAMGGAAAGGGRRRRVKQGKASSGQTTLHAFGAPSKDIPMDLSRLSGSKGKGALLGGGGWL